MIVIDAITRGVASDTNDWQFRRLYLPACLLALSLLSLALSAYRPSQPSYSTILSSSRLLCGVGAACVFFRFTTLPSARFILTLFCFVVRQWVLLFCC